ncbi:TonB-dependent receptor [Flavilitoribacter nigricans]|nr:TonB-dependent receptor [Flavilitoribacter nigricans]
MFRIALFYSLLLAAASFPVCPLSGQHLSGYITDKASGESLIGVHIYDPESQTGTTTNAFGFFQMISPEDSLRLQLSYVGYQTVDTTIAVARSGPLKIGMQQAAELPEVEVHGTSTAGESRQLGRTMIPMEQLNKVPPLLGAPDPFKALALTPGISNGTDGTSDIYVRGGTPDQNLILYDGAKVYNANHLFGLLSPFNPDVVKDIQVYKGAFPARYGGRLSSVVDVSGKEGDKQRTIRKLTIGLVNSRLLLEGPIVKNKLSYTFGARSAHLAALLLLGGKGDGYQNYYFYDLNGKLNFKTDKSNLSLSTYSSWDNWLIAEQWTREQKSKLKSSWGNRTASLRYARATGKRLFLQGLLTYNRYQQSLSQKLVDVSGAISPLLSQAFIQEWDAKLDADYQASRDWQFNFGLEGGLLRINPRSVSVSSGIDSTLLGAAMTDWVLRLAPYVENEIRLGERLQLTGGLRFAFFRVAGGQQYAYPEPRLSMDLRAGPYLFKAAYAHMHQPLHLLTANAVGISNNIWVSAKAGVRPQSVIHYSLGAERPIGKEWFASAEVYYKKYRRLVDPLPGVDFLQTDLDQWEINSGLDGLGRAGGLEVMLRHEGERLSGWLAYTWSTSEVRFDRINDGNWYFRKFDRRHDVSVTGAWKMSNHWEFLTTFVLNSGYRLTLPHSLYFDPISNFPVAVYEGRNNEKTPLYHRLDIAFRRHRVYPSGRQWTFNIGIYNVYARNNPYYMIAEPNLEYRQPPGYTEPKLAVGNRANIWSFFRFLPFVNYTFSL